MQTSTYISRSAKKCIYAPSTPSRRSREGSFPLCAPARDRPARGFLEGDPDAPVSYETIFFGGTPSLLSPEEMERIMSRLRERFVSDADAEITMSAIRDGEPGVSGGISRASESTG